MPRAAPLTRFSQIAYLLRLLYGLVSIVRRYVLFKTDWKKQWGESRPG